MAPRRRATQPSRGTQKTKKLSKATSFLFPTEMTAKPERTQSNVQQNIEQLQTPTMRVTINKSQQQQQNHWLSTDSSLSHRGA